MGPRPTHRGEKLFPAVILSDERSEESKDPYTYPLALAWYVLRRSDQHSERCVFRLMRSS